MHALSQAMLLLAAALAWVDSWPLPQALHCRPGDILHFLPAVNADDEPVHDNVASA
jgi:hypothetical protein